MTIKLRKKYKVHQDVNRIQEKAIEQQKRLNKQDKSRKNQLRHDEKKKYKACKNVRDRATVWKKSLLGNHTELPTAWKAWTIITDQLPNLKSCEHFTLETVYLLQNY